MLEGYGRIGKLHARLLDSNSFFELCGICSRSASDSDIRARFDCSVFRDLEEALVAVKPDILLIATPHPYHTSSILRSLALGIHTICEKPLVSSLAEIDLIEATTRESSAYLTVMSQTRYEQSYQRAVRMVREGVLGRLHRCSLTETFLRSKSYFTAEKWRGTWKGEGGGVLVNQAPHVLDRYRWICGLPSLIVASTGTLHHEIAVEDSATIVCQHNNGLHGTIHVSTNEPACARLELVGDRGKLIVDEGAIIHDRWSNSTSDLIAEKPTATAETSRPTHIPGRLSGWSDELFHLFYEDFADALWRNRAPPVNHQEAIDVVQMIAAAQLSGHTRAEISLPVSPEHHQCFVDSMIAQENQKLTE